MQRKAKDGAINFIVTFVTTLYDNFVWKLSRPKSNLLLYKNPVWSAVLREGGIWPPSQVVQKVYKRVGIFSFHNVRYSDLLSKEKVESKYCWWRGELSKIGGMVKPGFVL